MSRRKKKTGVEVQARALDGVRGPSTSMLCRAIEMAVSEMPPEAYLVELAYVGDKDMRQLNSRYHNSRGTTDVLAFPDHERLPDGRYFLGEVVVNRDEARRRQKEGGGVTRELVRYVVHGVLHIIGYDDATDDLRDRMWRRQEEIMDAVSGKDNRE